jgi:NAD(P)-dependent dehydrogenase (short-subunit alcohol dehydrogenase family)
MKRLEGKIAIILGASEAKGMGAATARRFAEEGARLVLAARRAAPLAELARELGALAVTCDITEEASVEALAEAAVEAYGGLDVAVNFAGANVGGTIDELTAEAFMPSVRLHLIGTGLFIKHMARKMKQGGSIVTTSSVTAFLAPPGLAIYSSTKAGADQLVRIAAVEYGPAGIRVNSLSPGFTRSPITEGFFAYESLVKAFVNESPLGRLGTVEDIAGAALWVASDDCFATGQIIQINGGTSLRRIPTAAEMFPG